MPRLLLCLVLASTVAGCAMEPAPDASPAVGPAAVVAVTPERVGPTARSTQDVLDPPPSGGSPPAESEEAPAPRDGRCDDRVAWRAKLALPSTDAATGSVVRALLVDLDTLVVLTHDPSSGATLLTGIERTTGAVRYHMPVPDATPRDASAFGVSAGVALIHADDPSTSGQVIIAVDAGTGTPIWRQSVAPGALSASPFSLVYAAEDALFLEPRTGDPRWTVPGRFDRATQLGAVLLLDRAAPPLLVAVAHDGGSELWRAEGARFRTAGEGVVLVEKGDALDALDATTGERLWSAPSDARPLAIPGGFAWWEESHIRAVDARTGSGRWIDPLAGPHHGPLATHGDLVVGLSRNSAPDPMTTAKTQVRAWHASTGAPLWTNDETNGVAFVDGDPRFVIADEPAGDEVVRLQADGDVAWRCRVADLLPSDDARVHALAGEAYLATSDEVVKLEG